MAGTGPPSILILNDLSGEHHRLEPLSAYRPPASTLIDLERTEELADVPYGLAIGIPMYLEEANELTT